MGTSVELFKPKDLPELRALAQMFVDSGQFSQDGAASEEQKIAVAMLKIMAGTAIGMSVMESMNGIHFYNGKPEYHYSVVLGRIRQSGKYDYAVARQDDDGAEIVIYGPDPTGKDVGRVELGRASFTRQDAEKAGLMVKDAYKKYPRDMFFGRAASRAARQHCSDIFSGPVYSVGEYESEPPTDLGLVSAPVKEYELSQAGGVTPKPTAPRQRAFTPEQQQKIATLMQSVVLSPPDASVIKASMLAWKVGSMTKAQLANMSHYGTPHEQANALISYLNSRLLSQKVSREAEISDAGDNADGSDTAAESNPDSDVALGDYAKQQAPTVQHEGQDADTEDYGPTAALDEGGDTSEVSPPAAVDPDLPPPAKPEPDVPPGTLPSDAALLRKSVRSLTKDEVIRRIELASFQADLSMLSSTVEKKYPELKDMLLKKLQALIES